MGLKDRLADDMKSALRNRDTVRLGLIRMVRAQIKNKEISNGNELVDGEVTDIVASLIKTRKEAMDFAIKGDRNDLINQAEEELEILYSYLPEQLSEDEIRLIVGEAIQQSNASSPKDMGKVMGIVMPRVKGCADGNIVNRIVRESLME